MSKRLDDVNVQIPVAGNELPKFLTTELQLIALVSHTALPKSVRLLLQTYTVVDGVLDSLKPIDLIADRISDGSDFSVG